MSYKNDIDPCSRLESAEELLSELQELMSVYLENLHHT